MRHNYLETHPGSLHVLLVHSFQFPSSILLYGCITIHLLIYLLMNICVVPSLGLFTSKAAMNIHAQGLIWTNAFISLG